MYVRRSSGLVREISGGNALIGSLVCFNFAIAAITLVSLPWLFPGTNLALGVLLSLIPATALGGVYVLFGIAMPRSGGDYVFISRTLHPSIGLAANMSATAWNLIILGVYANWVSTIGLSGMFASIGFVDRVKHTLTDWAAQAQLGHGWAFAVGTIVIVIIARVLLNLRAALRMQKILFYVGMLGILVTLVVVATPAMRRSSRISTIHLLHRLHARRRPRRVRPSRRRLEDPSRPCSAPPSCA